MPADEKGTEDANRQGVEPQDVMPADEKGTEDANQQGVEPEDATLVDEKRAEDVMPAKQAKPATQASSSADSTSVHR